LLYLDAAEGRGWLDHLREDNRARVRFSGLIYPLEALLVGRPGELSSFDPERFVYRLDARGASAGRGADEIPRSIAEALTSPDRPAVDKESDALRKPADVLALVGVKPGMRIADLMAGGGWYSEILARAVGPTGHVYAQNNAVSAKKSGAALDRRIADSKLRNVESFDRELENLGLPAARLDAVFLMQFYHDTYWMKVDRSAMNREIFHALAPGGLYCIVDHRAVEGAGERDTRTLHRADPVMVRAEVEDAGFVLVTQASFLANPEDDAHLSAFDPAIRGKTDRFLLLFRRPREGGPALRTGQL
jgi:predicted methyltransferase